MTACNDLKPGDNHPMRKEKKERKDEKAQAQKEKKKNATQEEIDLLKSVFRKVLDKTDIDDKIAAGVKNVIKTVDVDEKLAGLDEKLTGGVDVLRKEVRKNTVTAILAAFAFIIALVWRDVITAGVSDLIKFLNIQGSGFAFTLISAVLTTVICVAGIVYFSKWGEENGSGK